MPAPRSTARLRAATLALLFVTVLVTSAVLSSASPGARDVSPPVPGGLPGTQPSPHPATPPAPSSLSHGTLPATTRRGSLPIVAATLDLLNNSIISGNYDPLDCTEPVGIAFDATDNLYFVPCHATDSMLVLTGSSLTVLTVMSIPGNPTGAVWVSSTDEVFVTTGSALWAYDAATQAGAGGPFYATTLPDFAYDPVDNDLYLVPGAGHDVDLFSISQNAVIGSVRVGSDPSAATYDPVDQDMIISNYLSGNVSVISSSTHTVLGSVPVGTLPLDGVWDAAQGLALISCLGSDNLTAVDVGTLSSPYSYPLPYGPDAMALDPSSGFLLTVNSSNALSWVVYPVPSASSWSIGVGLEPSAAAYDAALGDFLVVNAGSDSITEIDPNLQSVISTLSTGVAPTAIAYDPEHGLLFVTEGARDEVALVNASTDLQTAFIPVGTYPDAVLVDDEYGAAFVANGGSGTVSVISLTSGAVYATVPVGVDPAALAVGGGQLWVADAGSDAVSVVNLTVLQPTEAIPVGSDPTALAYDPTTSELFVANAQGDNLTEIWSTGASTSLVVGAGPSALSLDPFNDLLFVAESKTSTISVVDPSDGAIVNTYSTGSDPVALALDEGSQELYVSDAGSDQTSVLGELTGGSVATLAVGNDPSGLAYDPENSIMFGTNLGSASMTIFSGALYPALLEVQVAPPSCGLNPARDMTLDGAPVDNGSLLALPYGNYAISPNDCPGDTWLGWNFTGAISVAQPLQKQTTLAVTGNGTLTPVFATPVPFVVVLLPATCGPVEVNATAYSNGTSGSLPDGLELPIAAPLCGVYTFERWDTLGSVWVVSPPAASTYVLLRGKGGTLIAQYLSQTATLNVSLGRAGCGNVTMPGVGNVVGTQVELILEEEYSLFAVPCDGYEFVDWLVSSEIYLEYDYDPDATLFAYGNGTLEAVFLPLIDVTYVPGGCEADLNGTLLDAGEHVEGPGNYSLSALSCGDEVFERWTPLGGVSVGDPFSPDTSLEVTGPGNLEGTFQDLTTSPPPLEVSLRASPSTGVAPATLELIVEISGGDAPYQVQWNYGDGSSTSYGEWSDDSTQSITHTWENAGTYSVSATVEDTEGQVSGVGISVLVSAPSPTTSSTTGGEIALLIEGGVLGGLAIASVAWVLLLRRRRQPPRDLEGMAAPEVNSPFA